MKYLILALSGIFIITDLLICCSLTAATDKDDDSWHTLTQLHNTSYHSRAEIHHYYLTPKTCLSWCWIPSAGGTWTEKLAPSGSVGGAELSAQPWAPVAPAWPAAVALVPKQPSAEGTHRVPHAPTADLALSAGCKAIAWWRKMRGKDGQKSLL